MFPKGVHDTHRNFVYTSHVASWAQNYRPYCFTRVAFVSKVAMAARVGYSLAEAEQRVIDCRLHLRRCAQIIARQPDGDALPSTVGEAVTNAVAATQQFYTVAETGARVLPTLAMATVDPEKSVRDQAFRVVRGFLGKLEKVF